MCCRSGRAARSAAENPACLSGLLRIVAGLHLLVLHRHKHKDRARSFRKGHHYLHFLFQMKRSKSLNGSNIAFLIKVVPEQSNHHGRINYIRPLEFDNQVFCFIRDDFIISKTGHNICQLINFKVTIADAILTCQIGHELSETRCGYVCNFYHGMP